VDRSALPAPWGEHPVFDLPADVVERGPGDDDPMQWATRLVIELAVRGGLDHRLQWHPISQAALPQVPELGPEVVRVAALVLGLGHPVPNLAWQVAARESVASDLPLLPGLDALRVLRRASPSRSRIWQA